METRTAPSAAATFTLDDAIALAYRAHDGQTDKGGHPYITHPIRVMERVEGVHERMAAVLHDVIEDTPLGADDLRAAGCPDVVVRAVVALSKLPGEPLETSMARAAADPIAVVVKRADIADNNSEVRLGQLDRPTQARLRVKYARSLQLLDQYARGDEPRRREP